MGTTTHPALAVDVKAESFFKDPGARAEQTPARFQGRRLRLPASPLPVLAQEQRLPVEDLLGQLGTTTARAKRGPSPPQAQPMERISALPKRQHEFVIQMIEMALTQRGR